MEPFIRLSPKIELHVHLEGTLTPELRFALAQRNLIPLASPSLHELREEYNLLEPISIKGTGPSAFFKAYYGGMEVLVEEEDFYDLAMAYFERSKKMGVIYAEVMFDLQAHTRRGVDITDVMNGLRKAKEEAKEKLNVSESLCVYISMQLHSNNSSSKFSTSCVSFETSH